MWMDTRYWNGRCLDMNLWSLRVSFIRTSQIKVKMPPNSTFKFMRSPLKFVGFVSLRSNKFLIIPFTIQI